MNLSKLLMICDHQEFLLYFSHYSRIGSQKATTILAKYSYLSDGTKLSATDASGNGLYYVGSLVYEKQGSVLSVESAGFSGGRFLVSQTSGGTVYSPHYYVTDHLGSTRVITNVSGQVQEACDYYPFGLRWQAGTLTTNRYRYNGKEEQGFLNVPYIDYGARQYDPKYRLEWNGMDKLAEMTPGITPFAFCNNNPTRFVDHFGLMSSDTLVVVNIDPVIITGERQENNTTYMPVYMAFVTVGYTCRQPRMMEKKSKVGYPQICNAAIHTQLVINSSHPNKQSLKRIAINCNPLSF